MIAKNSSSGYFRTEGIVTDQLENNGEVHDGKQDRSLCTLVVSPQIFLLPYMQTVENTLVLLVSHSVV